MGILAPGELGGEESEEPGERSKGLPQLGRGEFGGRVPSCNPQENTSLNPSWTFWRDSQWAQHGVRNILVLPETIEPSST